MLHLNHDGWAAVGQYLDPISLFNLSSTCKALHADLSANNTLFHLHATRRWGPALCTDSSDLALQTVQDWHGLYMAAHRASAQLATTQPWTASIPVSIPPKAPSPKSAQLLVGSSLSAISGGSNACSSGSNACSSSSPAWLSTTWGAAAFNATSAPAQLHWWQWNAQADRDPPFVNVAAAPSSCAPADASGSQLSANQQQQQQSGQANSAPTLTPTNDTPAPTAAGADSSESDSCWESSARAHAAAALAAGRAGQHWCSAPASSHTAAVTVMLEVPTGGPMPGFATASEDQTIKLWAPFAAHSRSSQGSSSSSSSTRDAVAAASSNSSSSSSAGTAIRAVRTLTGHTGHVTALALAGGGDAGAGGSSEGGAAAAAPILVSASADKTIKLWSLKSLYSAQQGGSGTGSSGGCEGVPAATRVRTGGEQQRRLQQQQQQQVRNPLLGTMRGHSGTVTALLSWPQPGAAAAAGGGGTCDVGSSSSGSDSCSSSIILSCGTDCRVKLWDVAESRRCCVGTWRLSGPCRGLLGGGLGDAPGGRSAVVMLPNTLEVLDCRVAPSSSAVTHGVLRLPFKGLSTAAACGNIVAAGGREGVRAWDVRMCSSSHSSSGGSSSSLLLSGTLPSKAPVTLLHLDSLKLVAASHQTQLHSAAGVAVWSLPECHRVDVPSSCLSGLHLHPNSHPVRRASIALGAAADAATQRLYPNFTLLIQILVSRLVADLPSGRQRLEATAIGEGLQQVAPGAVVDDSSSDDEHNDGESNDSDGGSSGSSSSSSTMHGGAVADDAGEWCEPATQAGSLVNAGGGGTQQQQAGGGSCAAEGCIEPGVLALAVQGPVIAVVDTIGNLLLRDFTAGVPGTAVAQQFTRPAPVDVQNAGNGAAAAAAGGGALSGHDEAVSQAVTQGVGADPGSAGVVVAEQLSRLKFWRE